MNMLGSFTGTYPRRVFIFLTRSQMCEWVELRTKHGLETGLWIGCCLSAQWWDDVVFRRLLDFICKSVPSKTSSVSYRIAWKPRLGFFKKVMFFYGGARLRFGPWASVSSFQGFRFSLFWHSGLQEVVSWSSSFQSLQGPLRKVQSPNLYATFVG